MPLKKLIDRALGTFRPVDTINGTQPQRTSKPLPQAPLATENFVPPIKKQKRDEPDPYAFAESSFALLPETHSTPVRRPSTTSSIRSCIPQKKTASVQSANKINSQTNVDEFRAVDKHLQPPKRKRSRYKVQGSISNPQVLDDSDVAVEAADDEDDEDSVQLVDTYRQESQKEVFLDEYSRHFNNQPRTTNNRDSSQRNAQKRKSSNDYAGSRKMPRNSSPDPLAAEHENGNLARPRTMASSSESRRGEIQSSFKKPSRVPHPQKTNGRVPDIELARRLIKDGLNIESAVAGRYKYPAHEGEPAEKCLLSIHAISTILLPTNGDGKQMEEYRYLAVDLKKLQEIRYSEASGSIVFIGRSLDPGMSAGPKLILKFSKREELEAFVTWVQMDRAEPVHLRVVPEEDDRLIKILENSREKAGWSKVLRDSDNSQLQVAADVKLAQQRQAQRLQSQTRPQPWIPKTKEQPKLRDSMRPILSGHVVSEPKQPLQSSSTDNEPDLIIPESPKTSTMRTTRTRAIRLIDREPSPKNWTEENPGWEKGWRNSLVFPPQGKNRATVDKDDILRLDEGQFLNDNLIIFGLRCLQDVLERERPEVAKRVHFHNTFFFDKLKPSKSGGGINYDSVKGWTSKVDLFTKDFIVVPINEHAHWYVAIIYNAPRLIHAETPLALDDTAEPVNEAKPTSPKSVELKTSGKPVTNEDAPASSKSVPVVEAELHRMSISSSSGPAEPSDHSKPYAEDVNVEGQPTNSQGVLNLVQSDLDCEEVQPVSPALKKKGPKKPSAGQRKHDTNQPKIITLDSLGSAHSPACSFLRQYLVAELKDKKNIDIPDPGKLGFTAKNIPLQENYCDCGLYLLGYIEAFQRDPDRFIRRLLQHEEPEWVFSSSDMRHQLRKLIFDLQTEQQEREDDEEAEKRDRKRRAAEEKRSQIRSSPNEGRSEKLLSDAAVGTTKTFGSSGKFPSPSTGPESPNRSTIDVSALVPYVEPVADVQGAPVSGHNSHAANLTSSRLTERSESSDTSKNFLKELKSSGSSGNTSRNPVDLSSSPELGKKPNFPDITRKLRKTLDEQERDRQEERQRAKRPSQDPDTPRKSVESSKTNVVVKLPTLELKKRRDAAAKLQSSGSGANVSTSDLFRKPREKQTTNRLGRAEYVDPASSPGQAITLDSE